MKLYIKETGEVKTLSMMVWEDGQWGVDFFNDAECNVIDGSEVTEKEYEQIVSYWESEVNDHNEGEYTEQFGDYNEKEIGFFHD